MSENELKDLSDKVLNGAHIEISELSEEQKDFLKELMENLKKSCETIADFLKELMENLKKSCETIADFLNNVFVPAFEDCFNKLFKTLNISNDKYSQKVIRYKMLEKQTIQPLYFDKRRNIHICSRSSC